MLGGAYSTQYKTLERQHVDTIKTLAENEKSDSIARAKKLCIETNKRRRALAVKRKTEAVKEEKRRQQILAKRREKQQEATEKFQRGHISSRPNSGTSNGSRGWSPRRTNTALEDALKLVRGSPSSSRNGSARIRSQPSPTSSYYRQNSDPLSKPYFNKYAHPSINGPTPQEKREELHNKSLRNLTNSRNLFEQQLETYQQTLLEQQQKSLRDFNKQVMHEIEEDKNVVNGITNGELERSASISTVDSLEEEGSTDTLRESCDLDTFMTQRQNAAYSSNSHVTRNVSFADNDRDSVRSAAHSNVVPSSGNNLASQNIDSYSAQMQSLTTPNQKSEEQKQQFYAQRQREIQQQLQEQKLQQQKQQQELQQKVLEQQRKQQLLLQQQYEKQQEERREKERQQLLQQQQQLAVQASTQGNADNGKENHRPKAQMKAWGTPSPHPPTPATVMDTTPQDYVTHASPYSGKNTHTNMTVTTYEKVTTNGQPSVVSSKPNVQVSPSSQTSTAYNNSNANVLQNRNMESVQPEVKFSEHTNSPLNLQEKSVSFLETVTNDLTMKQSSSGSTNTTSAMSVTTAPVPVKVPPSPSSISAKPPQPPSKTTTTSATSSTQSKPSSTTAPVSSRPTAAPNPSHYGNSYGAAFAAKQQHQQQSNGTHSRQNYSESPASNNVTNTIKMNGPMTSPWGTPTGNGNSPMVMFTTDTALNGDDTADTDSVSTICEEREPEPKEVRGILKRPPGSKRTSGILKKSGSTGNMKEIRDSLEITRVHLQTSADDKEQRPNKKNVRFADLCYDDQTYQNGNGDSQDKLFHKRSDDASSQKPSRPVSAVTAKTFSPKIDSKPPRATSATTVRTSSIPRAKTQIVRPQAAAHIITQNTQNIDSTIVNELDKKVTIVNSNFMEKVPAMARANQTALSVEPASVYAVTSMNSMRPEQKGGHYAVSSIVMPKSESAPFLYQGGYNKQGPVPAGSSNGPMQTASGTKYEGAVYDDNGLRIDRTPTDDEINFLWDKLRTCLSRNSATPDQGHAPGDGHHTGPRQAAPVAHTYIDGNALGQFNSLNRVAQPNNPAIRKQNSLDSANNNNSYTRRYGLLQQRKQQANPNSLKSRQQQQQQQQGYTVYQPPVPSHSDPQTAPTMQNGTDVTESMAGFLAAEQMADQSVSDSRIHQAIEDAQARQGAYNSARPQPKVKSALSIEEQRLMESLDRLNDKLKVSEATIPNNEPVSQPLQQQQQQQQPQAQVQRQQHIVHVSGFKGHTPLSAQRRVIETGNHKARLRITSAALKRNIHRQQ